MGNSVLKRSRSRRSGHMIYSFRGGGAARASLPGASRRLALRDAGELCIPAPPDAPAPRKANRTHHLPALPDQYAACYANAMAALILPLTDAAAHWPERGALVGLDLGTKTIGV